MLELLSTVLVYALLLAGVHYLVPSFTVGDAIVVFVIGGLLLLVYRAVDDRLGRVERQLEDRR